MKTAFQIGVKTGTMAEQSPQAPDVPTSQERHFSPKELGDLWGFSADTIRRWFLKEPGVLVLNDGTHSKRRYRSIRIPASVAERFHRRLTKVI